jgi:CheY-like chemotaxis protein
MIPQPSSDAPKGAHILIVDDETASREFVDFTLREAGYITARATNAQEAMELCELFGPFDLLVTDELMPRMEGHVLAERLREREPWLKVIYHTGYCDRVRKARGTLWSDEACLEKPSSIDRLLETVSQLLENRPSV